MKLKRALAIFFACPVLVGVAVRGGILPVPANTFQIQQAQGLGFGLAALWVAVAFVAQAYRSISKR